MSGLLQLRAIPIINENDPVACEEYSLGDNDTLAALVATCIHADLVVLLSDIDGLYTADPHTHPPEAELIPVVEEITPEIELLAGGAGSSLGTGGMLTKGHGRQARDRCGCGYDHHQRLPRRGALRYCGGQACGHPLCGP